jgi:flagellar basal body-associated protein FliL
MNIFMIVAVVIGMVATLAILYFLLKEMKQSIKDSNEGKVSNRCELD